MTRRLSPPLPSFSLALALSLTLVACAQTPSPFGDPSKTAPGADRQTKPSDGQSRLGAYHWRLQEATNARGERIDALLVCPEQPLQFDFAGGRIAVLNACNDISGDIRIDGDEAYVDALVSTKMACENPTIMALDAEIGDRLRGAARFELPQGDPPRLLWHAHNGDVLRFVGEPTPETRYGGRAEIAFVEVSARKTRCGASASAGPRTCLEVRELRYDAQGLPSGEPGPWQRRETPIEGYTHQEGIRHVLRIKRFVADDPTTRARTTHDVLDMVIESEIVEPSPSTP